MDTRNICGASRGSILFCEKFRFYAYLLFVMPFCLSGRLVLLHFVCKMLQDLCKTCISFAKRVFYISNVHLICKCCISFFKCDTPFCNSAEYNSSSCIITYFPTKINIQLLIYLWLRGVLLLCSDNSIVECNDPTPNRAKSSCLMPEKG